MMNKKKQKEWEGGRREDRRERRGREGRNEWWKRRMEEKI